MSSDSDVVVNHVPLLDGSQVTQLHGLSKGFNLNVTCDQEEFVERINASDLTVDEDGILEYLVHVRDVPVGNVIPDVRLKATPARSLHWGREHLERYKKRQHGQSVELQFSAAMAEVGV